MPRSFMAAIIVLGITEGMPSLPLLKKNMDVITHEDPSIDRAFALCDIPAQALKKTGLVLIVLEDNGLIDTPHHDMMQGAGDVQAGLTWQG
jgi:hypothetical protein